MWAVAFELGGFWGVLEGVGSMREEAAADRPATDLSLDPEAAEASAAREAVTRRTESAADWRFLRGEATGEAMAAVLCALDLAAVRGEASAGRVAGGGEGVLADVRCADILADLRGE